MPAMTPDEPFSTTFQRALDHVLARDAALPSLPITPSPEAIAAAVSSLPALPGSGLGTAPALEYLTSRLLPGVLQAQAGPRYFGFVTGGVTPAAQIADLLVGSYDENVQVSLPDVSAAVAVEQHVLKLVLELVNVDPGTFPGRTMTTGATSSNVLGMACARDWLTTGPGAAKPTTETEGRRRPWRDITILAVHPHFSILKAASLVGLGRDCLRQVASPDGISLDLDALAAALEEETQAGRGVIVSGQIGEVNTGASEQGMKDVGALCKKYGAWLHIDAAFGGIAAVLPEYATLADAMAQADSLTLDGHKWLNVPYDCGLFYTRHASALPAVFAPEASAAPAYLSAASKSDQPPLPSPLYSGIENSRRFRALPLLASLLSLGRDGYADLVRRNLEFARRVAAYIDASPHYELLNRTSDGGPIVPLNIVLFAGAPDSRIPESDQRAGELLATAINATRKMYVTPTAWAGRKAVRLAVSNWRTGDDDWDVVKEVLDAAVTTAR